MLPRWQEPWVKDVRPAHDLSVRVSPHIRELVQVRIGSVGKQIAALFSHELVSEGPIVGAYGRRKIALAPLIESDADEIERSGDDVEQAVAVVVGEACAVGDTGIAW